MEKKERKIKLPKCIIMGAITHKRESVTMAMALLQRWHFTISHYKHLSFLTSYSSMEPAKIKLKMKWKRKWPGLSELVAHGPGKCIFVN